MHFGFGYQLPGIKSYRVVFGPRPKWYTLLFLFWVYLCYVLLMLILYAMYYSCWLLWQLCLGVFRACKKLVLLLIPIVSAKIAENKAKKAGGADFAPTTPESDTHDT